MGADLLVLLTDTEGVYTADPRAAAGRRSWSPRSPTRRQLAVLQIGHAPSPLGSGGMRSKVVAAEMASAAGIAAVIGSGLVPGVLARAWAGEPGRHALRAAAGAPVELQAVAQVREAEPRHR